MSYGIYIGKNHSRDGHAYLAGYGDEPSSHWLEVVPRDHHAAGARVTVGVTPAAAMPGHLSEIPQVSETARHLRVSYSHYLGVPAPLTNGGLNEYGVAVRDIWSPSREELVAMTPKDQTGPNYSDLARLVLERARTARAGVKLIGDLIGRYGYSTYGGNSHLIADPTEAWVVIECAGGQGLWAAERLGDDSIRVSRPGYIGEIPLQTPDHPDFLFPSHLASFASAQGWFRPGEVFNFNSVYGDGKLRWPGVQWIEAELARLAKRSEKIGLEELFWALRTPKLTGDTAGYGQVVPLLHPPHDDMRSLWHAHIGAIAAPFVPLFLGIESIPEEYQQHRYLSEGEAGRFLDLRHADRTTDTLSKVPQGIESTRSATAVFKRLLNLIFQQEARFLPEVTEVWQAFERRMIPLQQTALKVAHCLLDAGQKDLARAALSYLSTNELGQALNLAEQLAASLEARTRYLYGFSTDPRPRSPDQLW